MTQRKLPRWWWMLPVLLLSAALTVPHLLDDAIWFDEWITYFISGTGPFDGVPETDTVCDAMLTTAPLDTLCMTAIDNSWPPLFFLMLKMWNFISLDVLFLDRALPLLIGFLAISVTYRLGREMLSHRAGLLGALLLASLAFFIFYMHELRGYTTYVLMPALAVLLYWKTLTHPQGGTRALRWGFFFAVIGALFSHYIAAAAVLSIGVFHFVTQRPEGAIGEIREIEEKEDRRPVVQRWLVLMKLWINACLVYALWLPVLGISLYNEAVTERSLDTLTLLQSTTYGFSNNLWWLGLPLLAGAVWLSRKRPALLLLWLWLGLVMIVSLLGNIYADFLFHPRHIMGLLPALMLLIAAVLTYLSQHSRLLAGVLVGVWVGAGVVHSLTDDFMNAIPRHISTVPLETMQTMQETAAQCTTPDDILVLGIDTLEDEWIHDQPLATLFQDADATLAPLSNLVAEDLASLEGLSARDVRDIADLAPAERVATYLDGAPRVWVMSLAELPLQAQQLQLDNILQDDGYTACGTIVEQDGVLGTVYSQTDSCQQIQQSCNP